VIACITVRAHLVRGGGFVLELISGLDDDEGGAGDEVVGFEQAIHGRL